MSDGLKINKVEVRDWMNVEHVVLTINGESVTLRGKNGAGKSAILMAIMTGLYGKSMYPKGFDYKKLIRNGSSSDTAKVTLDLGDGSKTTVSTKVSITQSDMYLNINTIDKDGNVKPVPGGPAGFAKKLVGSISFDPQKFKDLPMKDKVKIIYDMCPGLQGELERFDNLRKEQQQKRTDINAELKVIEGQLATIPFDESAPPKPIDVVALTKELNEAIDTNKLPGAIDDKINSALRDKTAIGDQILANEDKIARLKEELSLLENEVKLDSEVITSIDVKMHDLEEEKLKFQPIDTAPIEDKIQKVNQINEAVANNKRWSDLNNQVLNKKQDFSKAGTEMKAIEERKHEALAKYKLPLDGLSIEDGTLQYMDPDTFTVHNVDLMSSGQFWNFATKLYCAINPKLSFMIVPNLNDLDKENSDTVVKAAADHGLQLLTHETIAEKDKVGLQIKITDGNVGLE